MSSSESEEETLKSTPPELQEAPKDVSDYVLPSKSKKKYEKAYEEYIKWKEQKKENTSESLLAQYFQEHIQKYKPPTVWATYSMLKSMIKIKENIDIARFRILTTSLKKYSTGYSSKKSSVFTREEIKKFLHEAPDEVYLVHKVIMIFGIIGGCRGEELTRVRFQHIKEEGSLIVVDIPRSKANKCRQFAVDATLTKIVKKYSALRPQETSTDRFFLNYQKQRCTNQPIGKNKISNMPKEIATWLNLKNPTSYTGHALRRTSATLLSNVGSSMIDLKYLGGWQADNVPQGQDQKTSIADGSNVNEKPDGHWLMPFLNTQKIGNDVNENENERDKNSCQNSLSAPLIREKIDSPEMPSATDEEDEPVQHWKMEVEDGISNIYDGNQSLDDSECSESPATDPLATTPANVSTSIPIEQHFAALQKLIIKQIDERFEDLKDSLLEQFNTKFVDLETKLSNIAIEIERLNATSKRTLAEQQNIITFAKFCDKYKKYKFPLQTIEEFDEFNADMENNNDLYQDITKYLIGSINSTKFIGDTMKQICQKFLSRQIMVMHTAQKQAKDRSKRVLGDTYFFKCVNECMIQSYITEDGRHLDPKIFLQSLGNIIYSAAEWEGRHKRQRKLT